MTDYSKLSNKEKHKVSIFLLLKISCFSFILLQISIKMKQRTNQMSLSSTVKKTCGGKDAQRSHQQLHRAAQIHAGEGIPPAGPKHQAGESRHPGDDGGLPETAAAAQDFSSTESPLGWLFPVLEGDHELPICQLQGGRCTSASEPLPRIPEIS